MNHRLKRRRKSRGATAIEVAVVLPMLFAFLFGIFEIGRVFWIQNMLREATRAGARFAVVEGNSSSQVVDRVRATLMSSLDIDRVSVVVKDARVFDTASDPPRTAEQINALPDIEMASAASRQLFLVRATVNYDQIAFINLPFAEGLVLGAQALMRHE